ncbi:MAG: SH3 domain-containing protein [Pseudomonadota bacterium]
MQVLEVTAGNGLRIREYPRQDSRVLDAMPNGMIVNRVDDILWNGNWFKIQAEFSDRYRVEGYSHQKFLARHTPQGAAELAPADTSATSASAERSREELYVVIASSLRLREGPDVSARKIMELEHDTVVTKIEDSSNLDWWKVSAKAGAMVEEGYVAKRYLAPIAPQPAPNVNLSLLSNIDHAIMRVQRFVGDYADALNGELLQTLNEVVGRYGITETPLRFSHFMAQLAHESNKFTAVEENLNYSAEALLRVFSKYFNEAEATEFARQPERIANRVYANRIGNGSEASGDGYRYRGRGFIQLTGRANYRDIGSQIGKNLEGNPDIVATDPTIAVEVSAAYWDSRNINQFADADDVYKVTKLINGGFNGIEDRIRLLSRAKSIWGG